MTLNALEVVAARLTRQLVPRANSNNPLGFDDWLGMLSLDNLPYLRTTMQPEREDVESSFLGLVQGAYRSNGVVFACILARYMLFSEVRFQYQQLRQGKPGALFGTAALQPLEEPEDGRTTGDMLATMMLDADLAGINYHVQEREGGDIKRVRPDWTVPVWGSKRRDAVPSDPDSKLLGFAYQPGGPGSRADLVTYTPDQVAWYSPVKDPLRQMVGTSWLISVLRDVMGDSAATIHKLAYFRNAATPNLVVTLPPTLAKDKAKDWIELFEQEHSGAFNAFRSIYFGGGATATAVGADLRNMDYRNVQGAGETRIIAASGMHPVLLGTSEGLQGSGLNAGNFAAAARWTADRTFRPSWRNAAGSLQRLVGTPNPSSRLWYDERDVPFLRQDVKDAAEVTKSQQAAIGGLIKDGFEPEAAVDSVTANDLTRLAGRHTGLVSVQLQPPGTQFPDGGGKVPVEGEAPVAPGALLPYNGPVAAVHQLLAQGWTLATPLDEAVYQLAQGAPAVDIWGGLPPVRSTAPFWPVDGPFASMGEIPQGVEFPAGHPLVRAFAGMFAPVAKVTPSPAPQLTAGGVRCSNLLANGKACGKLVARALGPGSALDCPRCRKAVVVV